MTPPEAPARSDSFRPVLGATVLLVFALLAIAALKSNRDLQAARATERTLTAKIAATRASSERLKVRIDRLRHDPGMLERLAREDLGLVRPGDMIVELPEPGAAPPSAPLPSTPAPPMPPPQAMPPASVPVAVSNPSPPAPLPARPPAR
ncbi:MAG TPA: septum formation initiator family protein [Thermoanaerobaculia bacterium]